MEIGLRESIINQMEMHHRVAFSHSDKNPEYCTWWFKFEIDSSTTKIRNELLKMEREKLVTANRKQTNNTKWRLVKTPSQIFAI